MQVAGTVLFLFLAPVLMLVLINFDFLTTKMFAPKRKIKIFCLRHAKAQKKGFVALLDPSHCQECKKHLPKPRTFAMLKIRAYIASKIKRSVETLKELK